MAAMPSAAIGTLAPNLVLMDLSMPGMNGIEAMRDIKRRNPETRVLVLTIHKTEEYIHRKPARRRRRLHPQGCDPRRIARGHPQRAERQDLSLRPDVSGKVINGYLGAGNSPAASSAWDSLTHREREVLKLVAEGHPNKFIADYYCLSVKTVEKHRSNLMKKLDLHNASMLTAYAIEKGLVTS